MSQHVIHSGDGTWAVRETGAIRVSKKFDSQVDAVKYARVIAKEQESELYVHSRDGSITERDNYGSTPLPPIRR